MAAWIPFIFKAWGRPSRRLIAMIFSCRLPSPCESTPSIRATKSASAS
eukprot:CAMPEP_0181285576 /NCGR_PEP_ID=MMETSP1097-20121128/16084_1 /TAXON_ID=35684 /ORGANISM="Pseudopedinella elastica, Strain CCMP716" /LENGTH=47 /DNA_ID= /DNA_START= /DNA_END= /DNA_ORIENTATION=